MANKIKCTCGHSWNKSDSSKKDMYVCHVCGNSNVPKAQSGIEKKITPEMIKGWEEYRNYLDAEGLYGDPKLNTGFGKKTFIDWATKNPKYGINWETLPIIGEELAAQKKSIETALKKGLISLDVPISELNPTDVTNAKSKNPWWPGTEFTSQGFTEHVEQILDSKGKVIKEQNLGILPSTETYDKFRLKPDSVVKTKSGPLKTNKNGGWLDKYEKAENGIEGTMGGLTDKGFNYNGAWGGPSMAMGGSLPGSVGFTYARTGGIPSNGPYAKKTMASAQDGKELEYKELPEITVVGSKDKQTRDFYNNLIDKFSEGEPASAENPFIDARVMGQYLGVMNMGKEYGFPKVKPETKSGIYRTAKGHYNPLTKTIYANDVPTWVSEMAHHVQMKDNIVGKGLQWLGNDLIEYIKQPIASIKGEKLSSPYTTEGTVEHEAHSIIQPMLEERAMKDYEKYRDSELAKSREKRFLLENRNLQNGGEMKFYQEGLDWKPRNISRDGSVIKDDRGQWAHPGEITEIGSPYITMEGVPYPVLGISDTGDTQMMYPGKDYKFKGKKVTEYPVSKKWLEKYK